MYTVENRHHYAFVSVDEAFHQTEDKSSAKASESALQLNNLIYDMLSEMQPNVPVLLDLRKFKITFSDLVMALSDTNKGNSMFAHPNLSEIVVVTDSGLLKMGAMALNQAQYGKKQVAVYTSLEEAMSHVEQITQTA